MLLAFNIHSQIDVITNSSTELFVCNIEKTTISVVEEILQRIVDGYNLIYSANLTLNIFNKPFVFHKDEYIKNKDTDPKFSSFVSFIFDPENSSDVEYCRKYVIDVILDEYKERLWRSSVKFGKYNKEKYDLEINKIYKELERNPPFWWKVPFHKSGDINMNDLEGKIIITGSDDNSIPYILFDAIKDILHASSYHLG